MSRDRLAAWRAGARDPIRWIVISTHGIPDWAREGEVEAAVVPFRITDAEAQLAAARQGLGMTTLPCFVGDADPLLVRAPGTEVGCGGAYCARPITAAQMIAITDTADLRPRRIVVGETTMCSIRRLQRCSANRDRVAKGRPSCEMDSW